MIKSSLKIHKQYHLNECNLFNGASIVSFSFRYISRIHLLPSRNRSPNDSSQPFETYGYSRKSLRSVCARGAYANSTKGYTNLRCTHSALCVRVYPRRRAPRQERKTVIGGHRSCDYSSRISRNGAKWV